MPDADPFELLIPRPTRIKPLGGEAPLPLTPAINTQSQTPSIPPAGYRLSITAQEIKIQAADNPGIHHAHATLSQIQNLPGNSVPAVVIEDSPALPRRGVMLDTSRCRIPTMQEFRRLIPSFAALKLDHMQCYTEHTFAYKNHPTVWQGSDPITPNEIIQIDAICRKNGIEFAANQNCFGHLTRWLALPDYAHLAETLAQWDFLNMPRTGPFSLCPTDGRSLPFVESLLDELIPCHTSPFINIGCDETHDVGQGRSANAVQQLGKAAVYAQFVGDICQAVLRRGRVPMFWGDIAKAHPQALDLIPKEAIALVWGYEPDHDFQSESAMHARSGRHFWVCPGTNSWRSFTGRGYERQNNIRNAAAAGIASNAQGMLITDWGDLGHHQVWPIALLGIAEAADAAWTGRKRTPRFLEAVSLHVFNDRSLTIATWLEAFADCDQTIRAIAGSPTPDGNPTPLQNASALFTELHHPPIRLGLPTSITPWQETRDRLTHLAGCIPTGADQLIQHELAHATECALWACDVAIARRDGEQNQQHLASRLTTIKSTHSQLWHHRSRPGGLPESLTFWDKINLDQPS